MTGASDGASTQGQPTKGTTEGFLIRSDLLSEVAMVSTYSTADVLGLSDGDVLGE